MEERQLAGFKLETQPPGILVITFTTPERLNGLNQRIKRELIEVLTQAQMDEEVRVVVITGSGRAFCAGGDPTGRPLPNADQYPRLVPSIPTGHANAIGTYEGLRI